MTHSRDLSTRYTKEVAEKGSIGPLQELQETGWYHPGCLPYHCRILRTWLLLGYCCGPVKQCLDQSAPIVAQSGPDVRDLPRTQSRRQSGREVPPFWQWSAHADARGQTQGTHGRLDDQCCGESGIVPFADSLTV